MLGHKSCLWSSLYLDKTTLEVRVQAQGRKAVLLVRTDTSAQVSRRSVLEWGAALHQVLVDWGKEQTAHTLDIKAHARTAADRVRMPSMKHALYL